MTSTKSPGIIKPPTAESGQDTQRMTPEEAQQDLMNQIAHVREMIGNDTTDFAALSTLGNLYFDANMYEEAITWYQEEIDRLTRMMQDVEDEADEDAEAAETMSDAAWSAFSSSFLRA